MQRHCYVGAADPWVPRIMLYPAGHLACCVSCSAAAEPEESARTVANAESVRGFCPVGSIYYE